MEIAILALGCFWGPEIKFSKLKGITKTEVGYCGGINSETTYKEVCTGKTNHAEVVKIEFDNKVISSLTQQTFKSTDLVFEYPLLLISSVVGKNIIASFIF